MHSMGCMAAHSPDPLARSHRPCSPPSSPCARTGDPRYQAAARSSSSATRRRGFESPASPRRLPPCASRARSAPARRRPAHRVATLAPRRRARSPLSCPLAPVSSRSQMRRCQEARWSWRSCLQGASSADPAPLARSRAGSRGGIHRRSQTPNRPCGTRGALARGLPPPGHAACLFGPDRGQGQARAKPLDLPPARLRATLRRRSSATASPRRRRLTPAVQVDSVFGSPPWRAGTANGARCRAGALAIANPRCTAAHH